MANPSHDKGNVAAAVIAWWEENRPLGWAEEDHVAQATVNCETDAEQALARLAAQLVRATPPSPSTAPEVPPFPESFGLADVPHAMNTPDDWDADYRATWQKLQVAEINLSQMRAYARKLRAALASRPAAGNPVLGKQPEIATKTAGTRMDSGFHGAGQIASRPAEVDDEGLPPMPRPTFVHETICTGVKSSYFTAEQYRQGQRDAVAADRARRGDEKLPEVLFDGNSVYAEITRKLGKAHCHNHETVSATLDAVVRLMREAPSHTTNKEGS